nr:MAG TPA: hypothetical protein [Caudoviricetes sp.]
MRLTPPLNNGKIIYRNGLSYRRDYALLEETPVRIRAPITLAALWSGFLLGKYHGKQKINKF